MKKIEVAVLNPESTTDAEKMMVCAARLTQRGHKIKDLDDFMALYNQSYKPETVKAMASLPHPTIQKLERINVVVVGASRRFLAQITRHQDEVKFVSASLQYSDYSGEADFVVPYELLNSPLQVAYLNSCAASMDTYQKLVEYGADNDTAGYAAPQGLRNILIMSAVPYEWKHMIHQRICRRNTPETRYVMLKIWEELYKLSPEFFGPETTGAFCMQGACLEGKMACGEPLAKGMTPTDILKADFPLLAGGEGNG